VESQSNSPKKILLIDEQPICRLGMESLIEQYPQFNLLGFATNLEGVEPSSISPDVIAIDIVVAKTNGIGAIKDLKRKFSNASILVVTSHDESLFAERCLRAGAQGFSMKTAPLEELIQALDDVSSGRLYLSSKMRTLILNRMSGHEAERSRSRFERLSDRELLIVQHISQSMDNREIAKQMKISIKTIESHRSRIKSKLELSSPSELVRFAMRLQNKAF
jgi:DNA-binding NarL/FixJ family response regulator